MLEVAAAQGKLVTSTTLPVVAVVEVTRLRTTYILPSMKLLQFPLGNSALMLVETLPEAREVQRRLRLLLDQSRRQVGKEVKAPEVARVRQAGLEGAGL